MNSWRQCIRDTGIIQKNLTLFWVVPKQTKNGPRATKTVSHLWIPRNSKVCLVVRRPFYSFLFFAFWWPGVWGKRKKQTLTKNSLWIPSFFFISSSSLSDPGHKVSECAHGCRFASLWAKTNRRNVQSLSSRECLSIIHEFGSLSRCLHYRSGNYKEGRETGEAPAQGR